MKQVRNLMTPQELVEESIHEFLLYEYQHKKKGIKKSIILMLLIIILYFITGERNEILLLLIPVVIYLFFYFFPGEKQVIIPEGFLAFNASPCFYVKNKKGFYCPLKFSISSGTVGHILSMDKDLMRKFKEGYDFLESFDKQGNITWKN